MTDKLIRAEAVEHLQQVARAFLALMPETIENSTELTWGIDGNYITVGDLRALVAEAQPEEPGGGKYTGHTPGPWKVRSFKLGQVTHTEIGAGDFAGEWCRVRIAEVFDPANAQLIADAPDLASRPVEDGLREALERYGKHEDTCMRRQIGTVGPDPACTCGLDAALTRGKP